jgi:NADH-quinone oxidoreductase subunit L
MTHAFFKALLFLGSGSVIHAMHHHYHHHNDHHSDAQDMRNMGGLKNRMPVTFWTFLIATLAISGVPGLSGFFSKDEILWKTFTAEHFALYFIALITAGITAFYMFRLVYMTFYGKFRAGETDEHIKESPSTMTFPLSILAVLAIIGGYIGIPHILGGGNQFETFLAPVFEQGQHILHHQSEHSTNVEMGLMALSVAVALIGIYLSYQFYRKRTDIPTKLVAKYKELHRVVYNKYYIDEIYNALVVNPLVKLSEFTDSFFDTKIVDGSVNGVATVFRNFSEVYRKIQTGLVQNYALMMTIGVAVILGWLLLK